MGERTRANQINFRLTEAELQQFQKNLKRSKLKQSDYLRKCVLEKEIIVIDDIKSLVFELKQIGNNLNQLTKKVNAGEVKSLDDLKVMNKDLEIIWEEVLGALKKVNK